MFRLLTDFVYLYNYEFCLSFCKIVRSSVILLLPLLITNLRFYNYQLDIFVCKHLNVSYLQSINRIANSFIVTYARGKHVIYKA
jgi:hypothetical protein